MRKIYVCEICGKKDFKTAEECNEHEMQHELEEQLKILPKGAMICPNCKGKGWEYGNDGADVGNCYMCNGKKFIIPKTIPAKTVYEPIG